MNNAYFANITALLNELAAKLSTPFPVAFSWGCGLPPWDLWTA